MDEELYTIGELVWIWTIFSCLNSLQSFVIQNASHYFSCIQIAIMYNYKFTSYKLQFQTKH